MVTADDIKSWIEAGLPESQVVFAEEDGQHFEVVVLCSAFEGKNRVARHRMVYDALGNRMKSNIHVLSLKTDTPELLKRFNNEYQRRNSTTSRN